MINLTTVFVNKAGAGRLKMQFKEKNFLILNEKGVSLGVNM